jgi:GNAT superfamily N-acetyltransferase
VADPPTPGSVPASPTIRTRRPERDDAEAVAAVMRAAETAACGHSLVSSGDVLFDWADPRSSLARDAWVAVDAQEQVVAYACSFGTDPASAIDLTCAVHPDVDGGGLDAHLMGLVLRRAGEQADEAGVQRRDVTLAVACVRGDARRRELFQRLGFVHTRVFLRMMIAAEDLPEAPPWPDGITVNAFRPGADDHALHEVIQEAFLDHYRAAPVPFDVWSAQVFGDEDFHPELVLLARDGGDAVGAVVALPIPAAGLVDQLAVRRPWRGRGLGTALLVHALHLLAARGYERLYLGVDSQSMTGADRLYRRIGMRPQRENDLYERRLGGGATGPA